ncbi:hypothetical protein J4205_02415 [Candidatus Pacearchaeota archaeon]|nr:hypothetical protein [Candidatus Pacearchaeota archaeon]
MPEICILCKTEIKELLPGKFNGTMVKINKNTSTGRGYVCRDCQKEYGNKLKEVLDNL